MEKILVKNLPEEEERIRILRLRALKQITLSRFSTETRNAVNKIIDELVCEVVFEFHMALKINLDDSKWFSRRSSSPPHESLLHLFNELNIIKENQDVYCPKCSVPVKCPSLSKHLAVCMNPQQNTYSYSSRNSSLIARQRIQEGFKSSNDESRIDIDDVQIRSKKRNKSRKNKITTIR